ncbi:hypothetical protein EMGBS2_03460 [Actinomycetota bacterium]|nr:hypothetical protein EMGBS2_03460 [Actinomycetota bacterium]
MSDFEYANAPESKAIAIFHQTTACLLAVIL